MSDLVKTVHASCVAIGGAGVLLCGPSGAGKSDLVLRLIDWPGAAAAVLVADDRVVLTRKGGRILAAAPKQIAGLLEVRGLGVIERAYLPQTALALAIDLVAQDAVPRLPDLPQQSFEYDGAAIPRLTLAPFEASAPAKIRMSLEAVQTGAMAGQGADTRHSASS